MKFIFNINEYELKFVCLFGLEIFKLQHCSFVTLPTREFVPFQAQSTTIHYQMLSLTIFAKLAQIL